MQIESAYSNRYLRVFEKIQAKRKRSSMNTSRGSCAKNNDLSSPGDADFTIELQGTLMKVKGHQTNVQPTQLVGSKRGNVQTFSRKSRKRMLELVARLQCPADTRFVTLTWSDMTMPADTKEVQRQLKVLFMRLRRVSEDVSALWRIELKDRKSGMFFGAVVPHVHMLIFNAGDLALPSKRHAYDGWINDQWKDITGHDEFRKAGIVEGGIRTDDVMLNGNRQTMYYVSKYAAKLDGACTTLVNAPYQHSGRFWGVVQASKLPWADCTQITVKNARKGYFNLRRACHKYWSGVRRPGHVSSWTMFICSAQRWHSLLLEIVLDDDDDMVVKPVIVYNKLNDYPIEWS